MERIQAPSIILSNRLVIKLDRPGMHLHPGPFFLALSVVAGRSAGGQGSLSEPSGWVNISDSKRVPVTNALTNRGLD
jgi:hypothetical protein